MSHVNTTNVRYFSSIEWLRFLAAFGIVWFHTENAQWRSVGYAGLPIFLLVFGFLIVVHYDEIGLSEFVKRRALRLLVPWAFWSVIYIAARYIKAVFIDKDTPDLFSLNTLLIGGSLHLWFLPFSFLLALVFWLLCKVVFKSLEQTKSQVVWISLLLIVSACSFYFCDYIRMNYNLMAPFSQWLFALPSLPVGFAFGYIVRSVKTTYQPFLFILICIITIFTCFYTYRQWDSRTVVSYGVGTWLTILAVQYQLPYEKTAKQFSALTYGIYLIHPLVISVLGVIFHQIHPAVMITSVFVLSFAIVYFLKRTLFRFVL